MTRADRLALVRARARLGALPRGSFVVPRESDRAYLLALEAAVPLGAARARDPQ